MSMKISQFIESIAAVKREGLFNPWSQDNDDDLGILDHRQRVKRLRSHINIRPDYLLIGEAPGYQGARYSGIPFTSERLLFEGAIPRLSNMKGQRISTRHRPWSEPSASIIWKVLHELGIEDSTILWNAVP